MTTTAHSHDLPLRYRLSAAAIAILVQGLVFVPILCGIPMTTEQAAMHNGSSREGSGRIEVVFLPPEQIATSTTSPARPTTRHASSIETAPEPELPRPASNAPAGLAVPSSGQIPVTASGDADFHVDAGAGVDQMPQGNQEDDYMTAMRAAVARQWQSDGGRSTPAGCRIAIEQVAGGRAVRAWILSCEGISSSDRIRLETAVMRAQLPYAGFESRFRGHLEMVL